jgi:transposase-like protein/IS1 family transposase
MKSLSCPNSECPLSKDAGTGNIIRYGFYSTNSGKRRRYRCRTCGKTFCSNAGTPYHRLQHRRATFDEVARLSVEGLNKSAIARVKRIAWNTVARWLERAAHVCRRFNARKMAALSVAELQADEIRTIVGSKEHPIWIFTTIDVWSRLWPATVVGRRSYRNTLALFQNVASRMNLDRVPLIITDGFEFYKRVVRRILGPACLYGQVIKTRRNDRIRAKSADRRRVAIRRDAARLRGLVETEHFFRRAAEPHDPTGLGLPFSADDLPRAGRSASKIIWTCFAATTTS